MPQDITAENIAARDRAETALTDYLTGQADTEWEALSDDGRTVIIGASVGGTPLSITIGVTE